MARKKQLTYNDMSRAIQEMQERQKWERERMAQVMSISLLSSGAEAVLSDCSDADLRRIMSFVADDIGNYVERLNAEKKAKMEAQKTRQMAIS